MGAGKPALRLGFLGVGRIGLDRMARILQSGVVNATAISDPSPEMINEAIKIAPQAQVVASFDDLLDREIDGIIIATPSALHAQQSIRALERGIPVFCQKPLGRTQGEVADVVTAARQSNVLLGVDLSYRYTAAMQQIRDIIRSGELEHVFAADLIFHNAYGPDKPWFYDKALSGGGCVMDLGVHLVDLALWALDFPAVAKVESTLFSQGRPIQDPAQVEDFAVATIELAGGTILRLACSWRLSAGCDAIIGASFYGTGGGVEFRNVEGSFFDFKAERYWGTKREVLVSPPDAWPGRAAVSWAQRLSCGEKFDPAGANLVTVATVLDAIYVR
jgi:predicted dehydrogenase